MKLRALIGCEESQVVCIAFRELVYEAYSCDLEPCSGGHPEWHIQGDVFEAIESREWDLGILFPPCTYLTISANKWYREQPARKSGALVGEARREARDFFIKLYNCGIKKIAIENPIGIMSTELRKPDQVIQPWMFGHGETKATCLWLYGLPKLKATDVVDGRDQKIWKMSPSEDRSKERSKTFPGIAQAMAAQWSKYIIEYENRI